MAERGDACYRLGRDETSRNIRNRAAKSSGAEPHRANLSRTDARRRPALSACGCDVKPARARNAGQQIFHLVGKDAPIAQDEVLVPIGNVGNIEQGHVRLLR